LTEDEESQSRWLERNLRLYFAYAVLARLYFWAPIFFLFFSAHFPVSQVLSLASLYYAAVVVLEVPSGYLSDRVGRTLTLRLSALAAVASYACFVFGGSSFAVFALAQGLIAISFSFASGTDVSFHFDTLAGLGRSGSFGEREAWIRSRGLLAMSAGALAGGAIATFDLRFAYALSLVSSIAMAGVVFALREPPRDSGVHHAGFVDQLGACLSHLATPALAWLFIYVVLQTTLEHVPYEFLQPYLAVVLGEAATHVRETPLLSGAFTAGVAFVAAFAARHSVALRDRFGLTAVLLAVTALQVGIIGAMGALFHALVLPLVLLRSCYPAISGVLVQAAIAPRIPQLQRATYLSLHSLAGRLGYAVVLYGLAVVAEGAPNDPATLAEMLRNCIGLAIVGWLVLVLTRRSLAGVDPLPASGE
jgi:MFS family permease